MPSPKQQATELLRKAGFQYDSTFMADEDIPYNPDLADPSDGAWYRYVDTPNFGLVLVNIETGSASEYARRHSVNVYDQNRRALFTYAQHLNFMQAAKAAVEIARANFNDLEINGNRLERRLE